MDTTNQFQTLCAVSTALKAAARVLFVPLLFAVLVTGNIAANAQSFESGAPFAILIDADTGTVLYEKNADERMPPASMAKLMTAAVVFDRLSNGQLSLDDEFTISEYAWRHGGAPSGTSTMYAEIHSNVALSDLIRGIIIQSANDACIAVAEGIAGSELAFSELMNDRARVIGLRNSTFRNPTGLPDPEQLVTARDLAILARHLIDTYPDYYAIYSEPEFTWNGIRQRNRNPLLRESIGADGLKTGFTRASGYGLVASAVVNGQRLISVVNGLKTSKDRARESRNLLQWGFRSFEAVAVSGPDQPLAEARVYGGAKSRVKLNGKKGPTIKVVLPRGERDRIKAKVIYQGPIVAPVSAGQEIGILRIWRDDVVIQDTPLYAGEDVAVGSLSQRAIDAIGELLIGWL